MAVIRDHHAIDFPTIGEGSHVSEDCVRVPLGSLIEADSPRLDGVSEEHVRTLAESGSALPAIIAHRATMCVIDGRHRLRAAALRGDEEIDVRFFDGSWAEAFVLAVKSNGKHGLPLTLADRKVAAARIIGSHPDWSNRGVATVVGLTDKTVASIRSRAAAEIPHLHARIGRDGRARPVDAAEGRRRASEVLRETPGISLRRASAIAGVSVGTVRDVRDRLKRGEDPVSPRRRPAAVPIGESAECAPSGSADVPVKAVNPALILQRLRQDPSLRFSESGRALLRKLDAFLIDDEEMNCALAMVPDHCAGAVADLVAEGAKMWQDLVGALKKPRSS
ncbi:ParB N-terminal domain-containing protein [Amycolatopsis sp. lyj-23]|uniref:ParB/RepB/Spo0J family partition protein n=1 Tax=Amycolatopsis sp. lyj-23 TaxID=2789283 RepID=UPI003979D36C